MVALSAWSSKNTVWLLLVSLLGAGCGDDLVGMADVAAPLATIQVQITGDLEPLRPPGTEAETPRLRVALVWGQQVLPEPFCAQLLLPGDPLAMAVAKAGCRDPFGFVPNLVGANAAVVAGAPTRLELLNLPSAEVMVGEVTSRIAYGSLMVYDDRNDNGTLDLHSVQRKIEQHGPGSGGHGPGPAPDELPKEILDFVYGASFVSMTLPDQRIAFREGGFDAASAFLPRPGCAPPPVGFSVLGAGGFSAAEAILAFAKGELPQETGCTTAKLEDAVVDIALQATETLRDVACYPLARRGSGATSYSEPPETTPDMKQPWTCAALKAPGTGGLGKPAKPGSAEVPEGYEMVLALPPGECKALEHFTLRGCWEDPACDDPRWDLTAHPPVWWPCPNPGAPNPGAAHK